MKVVFGFLAILLAGSALAETRVVDGDTLEVDGTIYRLNGIDAPEHGQRCGDWACGEDATAALVEIVKGRDVTCDPVTEDGYGRVIATCRADGRDVGAEMIGRGLAWAFLKYSDAYALDELNAKSLATGIWSAEYETPWEFRDKRWKAAVSRKQGAPDGCPIKGNISRNGRIYHAPWSPWYGRTRIDPGKGERWFCSEAEAAAAGWRAPYWN
jgi:endonuclease YncB( thermonuclease family)